jgi:DNA-binding NarL/FixJ family response regulator
MNVGSQALMLRTMEVIRTLVVDDHPLFAETLAVRLSREPDLEVLPVAGDSGRALALLSSQSPAVVLLDLVLGTESGLNLLEEIAAIWPDVSVVMLTGVSAADQVVEAVRRGASAWLPKTVDGQQLVRVIRGVFRGESWIPPDLLRHVLRQLTAVPPDAGPDPLDRLTARERSILQCAIDGLSRPDIARKLFLSPNTVRTHRQNLLGKLEVHSTLEAVSLGLRYGMRPSKR